MTDRSEEIDEMDRINGGRGADETNMSSLGINKFMTNIRAVVKRLAQRANTLSLKFSKAAIEQSKQFDRMLKAAFQNISDQIAMYCKDGYGYIVSYSWAKDIAQQAENRGYDTSNPLNGGACVQKLICFAEKNGLPVLAYPDPEL